jgi:hypothetical protein
MQNSQLMGDSWLDERIVGALLEGRGGQQSFLVCVSIYKVMVQRCLVNQNNCSLSLRMTQPFDFLSMFFLFE